MTKSAESDNTEWFQEGIEKEENDTDRLFTD